MLTWFHFSSSMASRSLYGKQRAIIQLQLPAGQHDCDLHLAHQLLLTNLHLSRAGGSPQSSMRLPRAGGRARHHSCHTLFANVMLVTNSPDSVDRYIFRFHHIIQVMSLSDNRHWIFLPWHLTGNVQPIQYGCSLCFHMLGCAA